MYAWMMRLKQPDGSFVVHEHGEIDVRASYCVVAVASMLGIATPALLSGAGAFIASCQTYEGGFAALSGASYSYDGAALVPAVPVPLQAPQGEAHGGYSFCALAAHEQLHHVDAALAPPLNVPALVRWSASLQGGAIEGGGCRGRTNKLVDGCYGWFSGGGLMTLVESTVQAADAGKAAADAAPSPSPSPAGAPAADGAAATRGSAEAAADDASSDDDSWHTDGSAASSSASLPPSLLHRAALRHYILCVAQEPRGGLVDKPGKRPDAYHTCYNLSGLSLCEHRVARQASALDAALAVYDARAQAPDAFQRACFGASLAWAAPEASASASASVRPTHPVFNVALDHAARFLTHMYVDRVG